MTVPFHSITQFVETIKSLSDYEPMKKIIYEIFILSSSQNMFCKSTSRFGQNLKISIKDWFFELKVAIDIIAIFLYIVN